MSLEQQLVSKMEGNSLLRENDRMLILQQWRDEGLQLTPHQEQMFMSVSGPESIRRTRQKIQEKGLCLPTERVQRLRRKRATEVRDAVRAEKAPIFQSSLIDVAPRRPDVWTTL